MMARSGAYSLSFVMMAFKSFGFVKKGRCSSKSMIVSKRPKRWHSAPPAIIALRESFTRSRRAVKTIRPRFSPMASARTVKSPKRMSSSRTRSMSASDNRTAWLRGTLASSDCQPNLNNTPYPPRGYSHSISPVFAVSTRQVPHSKQPSTVISTWPLSLRL